MVASFILSGEPLMTAFCSAWTASHSSYLSPAGTFSSFLLQLPLSTQFTEPLGAPLYPVLTMTLSFTITAPYLLLRHVEREDTTFAISKKYSSQEGRINLPFPLFPLIFSPLSLNKKGRV